MKRNARRADADGGGAGEHSAAPDAPGGSASNPAVAEPGSAGGEGARANRTDAEPGDGRPFARVFMSGESQVVQLPKEFRFDTTRVRIWREGRGVMLMPEFKDWDDLRANANPFTDDMVEAVMEQQREDIEMGRWLAGRRRGD